MELETKVDAQRAGGCGSRGADRSESGRGAVVAIVTLLIVAAIVIAGVVPRMKARAALKTETRDLAIPTVAVIHPKRGAPEQEIVLPGNIEAFTDSPIYARANGYLKKWYFDIGAHAKAGELLAEIESPEVDQQLLQARADLNTAQANYHLAQITADRYQDLKSTDSVAKQDVDNAVGDFEAKKAMVASAQSNVGRLEQLQSFEKVYAPFDGVITARNVDIGALIDSGASGGPQKELFHMAATRTLRVYINVPQMYSQAARPGLTADLTLTEFPGRRFPGRLVRTSGAIDQASRTLLVEVDVDNPDGRLLPGAFTQVHLKLPETTPTYILPVNTLIFRSQGMQVATVGDDNRAALKTITISRDFGPMVEVSTGISDADAVILNPPDSLVEGERVQVVQTKSGD
jgi:RND family efflux transporter MFP subunit